MTRPTAAVSWSGGKDSCAALHRVHHQYHVTSMVTMFDEDAARSRSHGLRPAVVAAQAEPLGLTQFIGRCTWPTYNDVFRRTLIPRVPDIPHIPDVPDDAAVDR